jgi:outer membrane protein assembly factor BamB
MRTLIGLFLFAFITMVNADNQATQFRGPNGQGIYENETALTTWTEQHVKWTIDLPGTGHASPVIWNDRIFVVAADAEKFIYHILALDASDGRILWQKNFPFEKYKVREESSFATSTPVVDAECVYTVIIDQQKTKVVALTHAGELNWMFDTDGVIGRHGYGMSPILVDGKVIITREQESINDNPFKSTWLALDKKSGKLVWDIERKTGERNSFSTPSLMPLDGKNHVIFSSEDGFTAVDPSNGKVVWEIDPFNMRTITIPVIFDNFIAATCKGKLFTIKTNGLDQPEIAYELESKYSPYCPSPLVKDGLLYNFMDNGYISCHDAETGELIWREKPAGKYMGPPVWIDGFIFATTTDGQVVVIKAGKTFELIAVNQLPEGTQSTPIVSNGTLYVQTYSKLIAIGK